MVAAPLLDSSSGCACTAMRRNCSATDFSLDRASSSLNPVLAAKMDLAILADGTDIFRRRGPPVSETRATTPVFPPGRYGRRRDGRRRLLVPTLLAVLLGIAAVLVAVRLYGQYGDPAYDAQ